MERIELEKPLSVRELVTDRPVEHAGEPTEIAVERPVSHLPRLSVASLLLSELGPA
jgi:hypothetical protein